MFNSILVPIDLADTDLAKPAIATAATLSKTWNGAVRLLNVLPMTPVMLAEYVPADFDTQQRQTSEEESTKEDTSTWDPFKSLAGLSSLKRGRDILRPRICFLKRFCAICAARRP